MRHYVLTRSAFGASVSLDENRFRLELLRRITVPSMAAQTNRDLTWLVFMADDDPLASERRAAFESAGLPFVIGSARKMTVRGALDRPYGPWKDYMEWDGVTLSTRLDDDDAFAPWAMAAVRAVAERDAERTSPVVWSLMDGWRIAGRLAERVHWPIPMFCTLQAPQGTRSCIMDSNHLGARKLGPLKQTIDRPAWLWVRHGLTRSSYIGSKTLGGWRASAAPITDELRAAFPVDWALIESLKGPR